MLTFSPAHLPTAKVRFCVRCVHLKIRADMGSSAYETFASGRRLTFALSRLNPFIILLLVCFYPQVLSNRLSIQYRASAILQLRQISVRLITADRVRMIEKIGLMCGHIYSFMVHAHHQIGLDCQALAELPHSS